MGKKCDSLKEKERERGSDKAEDGGCVEREIDFNHWLMQYWGLVSI